MALRPRPRAFLDSNVLYSGLYSARGAPGKVIELFLSGGFQAVISRLVLQEVIEAIKRKMPAMLPILQQLLVEYSPEVWSAPTPEEVSRWATIVDVKDAPILGAAIASGADYLVTGDKHFLSKASLLHETGIEVVSPAQFLQLL